MFSPKMYFMNCLFLLVEKGKNRDNVSFEGAALQRSCGMELSFPAQRRWFPHKQWELHTGQESTPETLEAVDTALINSKDFYLLIIDLNGFRG